MHSQNTQPTVLSVPQAPPTITDILARLDSAESRYIRAEKRFRVLCGALFGATTLVVSLPFVSPAVAQGYGITLAQAATRIAALETKTASMSAITDPNTNQPTVRFAGVNVQVVSGSGHTDYPVNGTGNVIIGYNELRGGTGTEADIRTGSHCLIVGAINNYTRFGGIVAGAHSQIDGQYASITGGLHNTATGDYASISGGVDGTASGGGSSVSGGASNVASGLQASVSGGAVNRASGYQASVSGGDTNTAAFNSCMVSGGTGNTASGFRSTVCGGANNRVDANGDAATVSGGGSLVVNSGLAWAAGSQMPNRPTSGNFRSP